MGKREHRNRRFTYFDLEKCENFVEQEKFQLKS